MPTPNELIDLLAANRKAILDKSLEDTIYWCQGPNEARNKPTDQYWMKAFEQPTFTELGAHRFLATWQLSNRVQWDKVGVAEVLNDFIKTTEFDPLTDIEPLAAKLGSKIRSNNVSNQTSAASKFSMFAKPRARVFIWDQLANRSARLRAWDRSGRTGALHLSAHHTKDVVVDGEQKTAHDYAAYHASCAKVLDEEMRKADFQEALDAFSKDMARIDGPMNPDRVSQDFLARRLLDKFMFHEGHFLREQTKRGPKAA